MKNELTKTEKELVKTLIRLGDSEELAISTIIAKREKGDESELRAIYTFAYEN